MHDLYRYATVETGNDSLSADDEPTCASISMCECPKFEGCNAPVCPLDPDWRKRVHRRDEPVCPYLCEYAKQATRPILRGCIGEEHYHAVAEVASEVEETHAPLAKSLRRASQTPSRLTQRQRQAEAHPTNSEERRRPRREEGDDHG